MGLFVTHKQVVCDKLRLPSTFLNITHHFRFLTFLQDGQTPLMFAAKSGDAHTMSLLLVCRADPDLADNVSVRVAVCEMLVLFA